MSCRIVFVHGAFAESASWDRAIDPLSSPPSSSATWPSAPRSQREVVIESASHAIGVSRPDATVHPILVAAALRVVA